MGVGRLVFGTAAFEVAEDGGEGRQPEPGVGGPEDEGVGVGQRLAAGMSGGPLQAEFVGQVLEDELGPMEGPVYGEGRGRGTARS